MELGKQIPLATLIAIFVILRDKAYQEQTRIRDERFLATISELSSVINRLDRRLEELKAMVENAHREDKFLTEIIGVVEGLVEEKRRKE